MILEAYPEAVLLCSDVTAIQCDGFGIKTKTLVKEGGDVLSLGNGELLFLDYPSEMHLWDGLLVFEKKRGILFSSDLVFAFGKAEGCVGRELENALQITHEQIPEDKRRAKLQEELLALPADFIATGHGHCVML